MYLFIAINST